MVGATTITSQSLFQLGTGLKIAQFETTRPREHIEAPLAAAMPRCCTFLMGKDRLTVKEEQAGRLTSTGVGFP